MPIMPGVIAASAGAAPAAEPMFTQLGDIEEYSTGASSHNQFTFGATIPEGTEYLLIPIAMTANSPSGATVAAGTVGDDAYTVLLQAITGTSSTLCAILGIAAPDSGEQTITINYSATNIRRSAGGVWAVTNFGSIGATNRRGGGANAGVASVPITPTGASSNLFCVATQRSDEGAPAAALPGNTILDAATMIGTLGLNIVVTSMPAADETELTAGVTFVSTAREVAAAVVEVAP